MKRADIKVGGLYAYRVRHFNRPLLVMVIDDGYWYVVPKKYREEDGDNGIRKAAGKEYVDHYGVRSISRWVAVAVYNANHDTWRPEVLNPASLTVASESFIALVGSWSEDNKKWRDERRHAEVEASRFKLALEERGIDVALHSETDKHWEINDGAVTMSFETFWNLAGQL